MLFLARLAGIPGASRRDPASPGQPACHVNAPQVLCGFVYNPEIPLQAGWPACRPARAGAAHIITPLVASVRERNRAHRLWLRDKTDQNLQEAHRSARSKARKLYRSLRNLYFTKRCDTSDQRQLWAVMNDVTGRQKTQKEPEARLESLSKLFGDIVHDPMRPPELHIPHGPASASSFSTFQLVSVSDVAQCLQTVSPHQGVVLKLGR